MRRPSASRRRQRLRRARLRLRPGCSPISACRWRTDAARAAARLSAAVSRHRQARRCGWAGLSPPLARGIESPVPPHRPSAPTRRRATWRPRTARRRRPRNRRGCAARRESLSAAGTRTLDKLPPSAAWPQRAPSRGDTRLAYSRRCRRRAIDSARVQQSGAAQCSDVSASPSSQQHASSPPARGGGPLGSTLVGEPSWCVKHAAASICSHLRHVSSDAAQGEHAVMLRGAELAGCCWGRMNAMRQPGRSVASCGA
jgi:hypothetical protein